MTTGTTDSVTPAAPVASVSTHILDTSVGRPAAGVAVRLAARSGRDARWQELGGSATDADGRCKDLPALPEGTTHVRLDFAVEAYFEKKAASDTYVSDQPEQNHPEQNQAEAQQDAPANRDSGAPQVFFPEVAITFAVSPGEHYHVPLLLNPFGYSVYRGS
ncbi:hydroxyisourate hydrolase [Streptomyces ortus]|jgi:5-hydroxyisourate hydrolase|uniref:hydroxyisourate hydrolase n=1 Tax=Streptomyces ortus TaxID=2867268 RepID=A0ABT3VCG2_9ACTN|nr:hydroxyisourate hydrolase [Streptomyces ortus]MCX4237332.1 hydroxyisourate hydrolase [Streptomyces ortus]